MPLYNSVFLWLDNDDVKPITQRRTTEILKFKKPSQKLMSNWTGWGWSVEDDDSYKGILISNLLTFFVHLLRFFGATM